MTRKLLKRAVSWINLEINLKGNLLLFFFELILYVSYQKKTLVKLSQFIPCGINKEKMRKTTPKAYNKKHGVAYNPLRCISVYADF